MPKKSSKQITNGKQTLDATGVSLVISSTNPQVHPCRIDL